MRMPTLAMVEPKESEKLVTVATGPYPEPIPTTREETSRETKGCSLATVTSRTSVTMLAAMASPSRVESRCTVLEAANVINVVCVVVIVHSSLNVRHIFFCYSHVVSSGSIIVA